MAKKPNDPNSEYNALVNFGATESLAAVVSLSLVRELGPVLTSLLFAGRAGYADTPLFGIWRDYEVAQDVGAYVRHLRRGRFETR